MNSAILFQEKQRFTQWWLYAILLLPFGFMVYSIWTKGTFDLVSVLVESLVLASILTFIFLVRLETRISEEGISIQFFPFIRKPRLYPWEALSKVYVREYSPLGEYGGWGLRYSLQNGKAYNIKGNKGLQLELKDGHKLLIGTQKMDEIQQVLTSLNKY